jgi:hypothetical protein
LPAKKKSTKVEAPREASATAVSPPQEVSPEGLASTSPEKAEAIRHTHKNIQTAAEAPPPRYKGIAILGSHPATVLQAPFDDPEWLIYACSPHNLAINPPVDYAVGQFAQHPDPRTGKHPGLRYLDGGRRPDGGQFRVDQWFEVHLPITDETRPLSYIWELGKLDTVWVRDPEAMQLVKGARMYPMEQMIDQFSPFFFTSSIAFIMAKAIVDAKRLGIPEIGIWGVMQASENEYAYQRPGIQYFITRAVEAGLNVTVPPESKLFEPQKVKF